MFSKKLKEHKEKQAELNGEIQRYTDADENYYITANTVLILLKRLMESLKVLKYQKKGNY